MPIELELEGGREAGVDARALRQVVDGVLAELGVEGDVSVGVSFVDEDRMRQLNAEHRDRDAVTDVLSFPIDGLEPLPAGLPRELGDVVICVPQVLRQAGEAGVAPGVELATMVVHGLLHLAGMDHETDAGEMLALQDRVVAGLPPVAFGDAA